MEIIAVPLMPMPACIIWKQGRNAHLPIWADGKKAHWVVLSLYKPAGTLPNEKGVSLQEPAKTLSPSWRLNDSHKWTRYWLLTPYNFIHINLALILPLSYYHYELPPWGQNSCGFNLLYLLWFLKHIANKFVLNWTKAHASNRVSHSSRPVKTFV